MSKRQRPPPPAMHRTCPSKPAGGADSRQPQAKTVTIPPRITR